MRNLTTRLSTWWHRTNPERATHMSNGHLTVLGTALGAYGTMLIYWRDTLGPAFMFTMHALSQLPGIIGTVLGL